MFEHIGAFKASPALIEHGRSISYEMLVHTADMIAAQIGKRSLVFLLCTNTSAAIAGYIGFMRNGIVPVMLDESMDELLLEHLVQLYHPQFFWMLKKRAAAYSDCETVLEQDGYVLLRTQRKDTVFPLHEELALLMTTSGSTGSPKFVRLSYQNLTSNAQSIIEYLRMDSAERGITNLPIHYVYGLSLVNTHLSVGAALVVTEKTLFQREFWQLMKEQEVTNLAGVPYTYEMMNRLGFFRMELPALSTLTQAGGKLDAELHRKFALYAAEKNKQFFVMYGAAEATARMGYLPPQVSLDECGAMGIAIPGGRFELVDGDGTLLEHAGISGELVYYGENVSMGYAECGTDLARGDEHHGRLCTGDIAVRNVAGYYTVVGRKKRFLKIFGKRVNLQEVEHILRQRFETIDVACAGTDDHLCVFTAQKDFVSEIKPFLSMKIGIHPTAINVKHIAEIPKNASGKTIYKELEQYYDL